MPDLRTHAPDNPDFARVAEVRQLADLAELPVDIAPTEAEAAAVARLLGARAVRKLRLRGRLAPLPGGGWRLEATLGATVVQTCVVSLDPVTTRVDQRVTRTWLPQTALPETAVAGAELVVDPEEDDEIEPLGARIDLGLVAIEALALALPAYPRKPGARLGPTAAAGLDPEDEPRPFAALAALRGKLGKDT
jgi:Large ribosomal RNA subunit accumulation protein YceD